MADEKERNAVEAARELNREGLTAYYDQMAIDGKVETTVVWLVDMSLLIQDDVTKRLKAKWSPCCPKCNFKQVQDDSERFTTFSEEYCGNSECDCHKAAIAYAAEKVAEREREIADRLEMVLSVDELNGLIDELRGADND